MSTPGSSPQHCPAGVSPLSLSTEARLQQAQQVSPTLSQLSPISQAVAMDALSLDQQLPYTFFTQTGSQQPPPPQPQPPQPPPPASQQQPPPPSPQVPVGLPPGGPLMPSASLTRGPQLPPLAVTVPSSLPQSPPENPGQPPMGIDIASVSPGQGPMGPGWGSHRRSLGAVGVPRQAPKTQDSWASNCICCHLKAPLTGRLGQGSGLKLSGCFLPRIPS